MLAKIIDFPSKEKSETTSLSSVLSFLNRVSNVPDTTTDFAEATTKIFKEVCTYTSWPIAHLYLKSKETPETYISNDIWFLEKGLDPRAIADFKSISEQTIFEKGKGIIGIIAQEKQAKAVEDVTVIKQFLRADAAKRSGVRGFFGFPILINDECVGVAEFYGREIGLLDETSLEIMQYVSAQLARLYEREESNAYQRRIVKQFEESVLCSIEDLAGRAKELNAAGDGVKSQAKSSTAQCSKVVSGSESILQNMNTLQETMTRLIDVEEQTIQSNDKVNRTVEDLSRNVGSAMAELKKLSQLTAHIETIVQNVTEVSGQVRMLGLNAAIEAARAGQAGKGFAIVAGEIKMLAQQSEQSSQAISDQLIDIQKIANSGMGLMNTVTQSMAILEDTTSHMSHVVSDQHSATEIIRDNLDDAQATFKGIDHDIETMNRSSQDLLSLSRNVSTHAQTVDQVSTTIEKASRDFIQAIQDK
ncbi:methyl-accepting chemotaxis protein [Terasakiella sp. A23]|uniref:methyl-accepting chemotaxis protein n=1 Tax=Terasakiella sp. FCG-A23 TaxID=3080561 RepID=UPI0029529685|nr:methyl-accepting chemotaxis protein [Terasakiella sp. A23]MDV7341091.1 methyl-accepting chemotaxis protein [Terasakiella sp. A23]